jgi:sugar phosphate isomerase/epimerase
MKISIVTDEISADPETAVELGVQWGIHDFELRGYFSDRAPRLSTYQKHALKQLLERYQANIIAVSPGLFKFPFPSKQPPGFALPWLDQAYYNSWSDTHKQVDDHLNKLLPETLEFTNELGAGLVISFGFSRGGLPPGPPPDELLETLHSAAERARSAGIQLTIENESGFWADTGDRTGHIIRTINHPNLSVNWDPGNAFFEGDSPFPDGYQHVRGLVKHVHFKDALKNSRGELQYSVDGEIDWAGQLGALAADGYMGFISIETHLRPKVAAANSSLNRLGNLITNLGVR